MSETNRPVRNAQRVLPLLIITLAALFYVYEFTLRVMPSAMKEDLMSEFGIAASGFGIMGSLFYWGYAPLQIPAGLLFDRFSTRYLLSIAVFLCGFGAVLFGVAHHFALAGLGRLMIGATSAFAFIGALVLAARWFEAKYFALITGSVQLLGSFGAIVGVGPITHILKHYSWRTTQIGVGLLGISLSILLWLVVRDRPKKPINKVEHNLITTELTELQRLKIVLSNPQTWWVGLYAFSSWAPMAIFPAWWGTTYLMHYYQISTSSAGYAIMFIWLGNALASPLVGWWSNRINSRRIPLLVCTLTATSASFLILYGPTLSIYAMYGILFFYGAAAAAQSITFGLVQDNMPPEVAGTAVGFNNMSVVMGGALFTPLVGFLLDWAWDGKLFNNAHIYSLANYKLAFAVIPFCGIIGLIIGTLFIKETHCQAQYELDILSNKPAQQKADQNAEATSSS